jgi:hypothetical protein
VQLGRQQALLDGPVTAAAQLPVNAVADLETGTESLIPHRSSSAKPPPASPSTPSSSVSHVSDSQDEEYGATMASAVHVVCMTPTAASPETVDFVPQSLLSPTASSSARRPSSRKWPAENRRKVRLDEDDAEAAETEDYFFEVTCPGESHSFLQMI